MDQSNSQNEDPQQVKVHCRPGQAVRINIEIAIGEADDILGGGSGSGGGSKTIVVQPGGGGGPVPPISSGDPDPDTTPGGDTERPIGYP